MKEFDIEKCTKYQLAITPEECRMDPDEVEVWINPIDDALDPNEQWDGSFGHKFEKFLIDKTGAELVEGLWSFDEGTFDDEEEFIREAKAYGFDVTIIHPEIADD